jgi:tripartite-type tricarboxylate transporter receptor subunit TctC
MFRKFAIAALISVGVFSSAQAQNGFPNREIKLIVPFAAGGAAEMLGKVFAEGLTTHLGSQVTLEMVAGSGGALGTDRVANARPDGHTLLVGTLGTHAVNPSMFKNPPYDSIHDFTPIGLGIQIPLVLVTRTSVAARDVQEFSSFLKENQRRVSFWSVGAGTAMHLGCILFNQRIGVDVEHTVFRSIPIGTDEMKAGRVDYVCDQIPTSAAEIRAGNTKGIAILSKERSPLLPDLKTAQEQGLVDFEAVNWNGIYAPRGTASSVVARLNGALVKTLTDPVFAKRFADLGANVVTPDRMTPEYLRTFTQSEIDKWRGPIQASGVRLD